MFLGRMRWAWLKKWGTELTKLAKRRCFINIQLAVRGDSLVSARTTQVLTQLRRWAKLWKRVPALPVVRVWSFG